MPQQLRGVGDLQDDGDDLARQRTGSPLQAVALPDAEAVSKDEQKALFSPDASQEEVQDVSEPHMSAEDSRLASSRSPGAEEAAALDWVPGDRSFDAAESEGREVAETESDTKPSSDLGHVAKSTALNNEAGTSQPTKQRLPSPWRGGNTMITLGGEPNNAQTARRAVCPEMHKRSSSVGERALRRLSKALPTVRIPTHLFGVGSTTSSTSPPKVLGDRERTGGGLSDSGEGPVAASKATVAETPSWTEPAAQRGPTPRADASREGLSVLPSRPSGPLHRASSDESLLYHSRSGASSFGDDDRFLDVREQVNSRLHAITDNWERPSFKLPQLPDILPTQWKRPSHTLPQSPEAVKTASAQPPDPLDSALNEMTGDVVILGGYRGSILRSAEPPHRQIWAPLKIGLNLRKVNLELGLDPEDEERVEETVIPSGMLQNIGPVDIARRLFKRIRDHENVKNGTLRVHDWGYDWRLSPHLLSRKLLAFVDALPCNRPESGQSPGGAYVIAHSLGGLIVRHAVNQKPELFAGVVFAATPQRCVNILGPIRDGDSVLFSENILTAKANFSMRTTFLLLPEDGYCFISNDKTEEYPIDFFNIDDWLKYRWSPCISKPLPPYNAKPESGKSLTSLLKIPANINLPNLPLRHSASQTRKASSSAIVREVTKDRTIAPQTNSSSASRAAPEADETDEDIRKNIVYLKRTLAEVKQFRLELAHQPAHQAANRYPPFAVIYGKDTPTVYAGRVACREAIAHSDAYDNLAFQSGDGVVLATAAMLPEGYELVRAGRVSSQRGHVTMLGDLAAVGKTLGAVVRGRQKGIGLGIQERKG